MYSKSLILLIIILIYLALNSLKCQIILLSFSLCRFMEDYFLKINVGTDAKYWKSSVMKRQEQVFNFFALRNIYFGSKIWCLFSPSLLIHSSNKIWLNELINWLKYKFFPLREYKRNQLLKKIQVRLRNILLILSCCIITPDYPRIDYIICDYFWWPIGSLYLSS